jgi:hypothetical protein
MHISIIALILAIATIAGGLAAIVVFLPRISVLPSDPVDLTNPFSASFTITNNNFIPLRQVNALLGIGQIVMEPAQMIPHFKPTFESRITYKTWTNHSLTMDERFTITISDAFNVTKSIRVAGADIAIIVSYKPWFLPIKREKIFRFVTHKQTNGNLYWYSQPLDIEKSK